MMNRSYCHGIRLFETLFALGVLMYCGFPLTTAFSRYAVQACVERTTLIRSSDFRMTCISQCNVYK